MDTGLHSATAELPLFGKLSANTRNMFSLFVTQCLASAFACARACAAYYEEGQFDSRDSRKHQSTSGKVSSYMNNNCSTGQ